MQKLFFLQNTVLEVWPFFQLPSHLQTLHIYTIVNKKKVNSVLSAFDKLLQRGFIMRNKDMKCQTLITT